MASRHTHAFTPPRLDYEYNRLHATHIWVQDNQTENHVNITSCLTVTTVSFLPVGAALQANPRERPVLSPKLTATSQKFARFIARGLGCVVFDCVVFDRDVDRSTALENLYRELQN